jgi:arginine-tRNA-protein transferase
MSVASNEELLVFDQLQPCAYLPHHMARLPLRYPARQLSRDELDRRLSEGDRRSGYYLYRATCPGCTACEAIRLDIRDFRPTRTQRRIERRGRRLFSVTVGPPRVDAARVRLFNQHREDRGLAGVDGPIDLRAYRAFLVDTCCETFEIAYSIDGQLVGVAICDRGRSALSAVYCHYDMTFSRLSPGVFSVLTQVELCRKWNMRYLYLGYYVSNSPHMSYKAGYRPHERLIDGQWQRFEQADPPPSRPR